MQSLPELLARIKIVLVEPSHPGNIGAAARAMCTMGLSKLSLVAPKHFPSIEAVNRASGAEFILDQAEVVADLPMAVASCDWVIGVSGREPARAWPHFAAAVGAKAIAHRLRSGQSQSIALVFGTERCGLSTLQLQLCQHQLVIPTDPAFSSLNLASAVQVVCYECRGALAQAQIPFEGTVSRATHAQHEGLFQHLEQVLVATKFLDPAQPKHLMARLRRLYYRAELEHEEIQILRGMLTAIERVTSDNRP